MRSRFKMVYLLLAASCSGTPAGTNPDGAINPDLSNSERRDIGRDAKAPDAQRMLSFSSCSLLTKPSNPPVGSGYDGIATATAECASTKVPAVWSASSGDVIDLFVKRYPAAKQPAKGQLWLLAGGPGASGSMFEGLAFRIAKSIPLLDIYMPDHRGTGKSSWAGCLGGVTPNNAANCAKQIGHLDGLTTTDAAKDLASLIDATRAPGQQVFILGASYGTYWAQRYMLVRPDQPTAVILDSTLPAVGADITGFDKQYDDNARAVLALCQADATCSAKLGPDPVAKAKEALGAVAAGKCSVPSLQPIRVVFGSFLGTNYHERLLLPASIYRILRCNAADQSWLSTVSAYPGKASYPIYGWSDVVLHNIVLSEQWLTNPTQAEVATKEEDVLAIQGFMWNMAGVAISWPRYPHDTYYGTWPSSAAPVLALQATLDPATPYGDVIKAQYSGKGRYFVELPKANHGVVHNENSPMADPAAYGCGWQVVQSFLANPTKAPDTSCIKSMAPLDFSNPPAWWLARVGITDLWENP